jgi:uncharacterized protein with PIN domain
METIMPFYIHPKTLSKQAKTFARHCSHHTIKLTLAREILSQLYGYNNNHHYQEIQKEKGFRLLAINQSIFFINYKRWIQKLALLASMNETQAKKIIHILWSSYLCEGLFPKHLYHARFEFQGEISDFVEERKIIYPFDDKPSIKDAIEALGVPHVEVGAILVNGENVDFEYGLKENDKVEVLAHNILDAKSQKLPLQPQKISFLLDVHLGTLARYLRMAGFDSFYENKDYGDTLLAKFAGDNKHILLSRDIGLLKRSKVKYGRWVRNTNPKEQFNELIKAYGLKKYFKPFSRCLKCNGEIKEIAKERIKEQVPSKVYAWCDEFKICEGCEQVYWKGSHYNKMTEMLEMFDA